MRKNKAAPSGPKKSVGSLENRADLRTSQASSPWADASQAEFIARRQLWLPLHERYDDDNPAVIAVRKADAAFFKANPSRLFHLRRAIKAEWLAGPMNRAGDLALAWREPAALVLVFEVQASRPFDELDTEASCTALFDLITEKWSGPLIEELRRKRAIRWSH